ncbi:DNA-binding protein [Luteibacter anthropi]|uniref:KfrA N-terminal DNA-binding domain-containing protein n=1 Tax=Luteibacter anthropi TaxID=564369 RepID=A0A7X5U7T4_9GAMM|nr:hypothetical protein [Luteibacter anthropi]
MLEAWRNRLGERLREMSTVPDVPGSVGQAMVELWRLAVDHANREVIANLKNESAELARERGGGRPDCWQPTPRPPGPKRLWS